MKGHVITSLDPREAFHLAAGELGLTPVKTLLAERGVGPYQETWCDAGKAAFVQYVELPAMEIAYFVVTGDPTAQVYVFAGLFQELDYVSRDQILDEARRAVLPEDRITAANRLAVAESDFDQGVLDVLTNFSKDSDEIVRAAATRALGRLRWPQNEGLFERLTEDESEWVRDAAQRALRDLRR